MMDENSTGIINTRISIHSAVRLSLRLLPTYQIARPGTIKMIHRAVFALTQLFFLTANAWVVPSVVVHTACGFVAGSAGAIAAYPIDFVKSQLQTEAGRAKYSGGLDAAINIVKEDGILSLYRGVPVQVSLQ